MNPEYGFMIRSDQDPPVCGRLRRISFVGRTVTVNATAKAHAHAMSLEPPKIAVDHWINGAVESRAILSDAQGRAPALPGVRNAG
jgi:hypothetical protein